MDIQHLRNATALLSFGSHRLLLDPMLGDPGSLPGFKMFGGGRQANPLVPLPDGSESVLEQATGILLTHEHLDHFDGPAKKWIRQRGLPIWAAEIDVPSLRAQGFDARVFSGETLSIEAETLAVRHGSGLLGWLMGPVSGYFLAPQNEPSLLITSDGVLTPELLDTVERLNPDLILAGAANFGKGSDILFSVDELVRLMKSCDAHFIFHHLESIDHCPTRRADLWDRLRAESLEKRADIPEDGERLSYSKDDFPNSAEPKRALTGSPARPTRMPRFQKWLVSKLP